MNFAIAPTTSAVVTSTGFPFPPVLFSFAFVAFWLVIGTVLSLVSGWRPLQDRYPARDDEPLLTLGSQSGMVGLVGYRGCLTFSACPQGLRVSVWKLFAPFQRAIEVPWDAIRPEPPRGWVLKRIKLRLGSPELAVLDIRASSWARLVDAAPPAMRGRFQLEAGSR